LYCSLETALDEQLSRYAVRRSPVGSDRYQRAYWWGLAGHRPGVMVQSDRREGGDDRGLLLRTRGLGGEVWGVLSGRKEYDAFVEALDSRGVRERELKGALEKVRV